VLLLQASECLDEKRITRARVVAAAMDGLWIGYERVLASEAWQAPESAPPARR
jgi:hypothetical protein